VASDLAELLADCYDDPGLFHEAILGRSPLHAKQEAIARSVQTTPITVVPAAHAVGKSWVAATIALHWIVTRPGAKIVTTSVSNNQLVNVLWSSIKAAHRSARIKLPGRASEGYAIPQRLDMGPDWFAVGWSAKRSESFAGVHGEDVLVIVDEASGVDQAIFDAIESLGYTRLLVLGNPIRATGHFRALYDQARAGQPGYASHHLTAFDSPYADLTDEEVRERGLPFGLTTKTWIERVRRLYGESSLYWLTRVLAKFPEEDHDQLIPDAWVDRAYLAPRGREFPGLRGLAVDISKGTGRDRSVLIVGDDLGLIDLEASNTISLPAVANLVAQKCARFGIPQDRIVYDAGGWAGSDFGRYLEAVGITEAIPYHGSGKGGKWYANRRSKCAWILRRRLDPDRQILVEPIPNPTGDVYPAIARSKPDKPVETSRIQPPYSIPAHVVGSHWGDLREELLALKYSHTEAKIALEPKADLVERLGRSPDIADTMIMLVSLWPDL
jgi:hypothetical protein